MSDNLALWHKVEKTPSEHTKAISGKSYKGTSPKPHWIIQKATETFGPCGIGWGFTVEERVENGAMIEAGFFERLHIAKVRVWYKWDGERGEIEHIGGTPFSGRYSSGKSYTDEDAPKKSVTDALVKALSMIGFAGDIFMGRYDDSKYVNDLREEEREAKREAAKPIAVTSKPAPDSDDPFAEAPSKTIEPAVSKEAIGFAREIRGLKTATDLEAFKRTPEFKAAFRRMNPVDQQYLISAGTEKATELDNAVDYRMAG